MVLHVNALCMITCRKKTPHFIRACLPYKSYYIVTAKIHTSYQESFTQTFFVFKKIFKHFCSSSFN